MLLQCNKIKTNLPVSAVNVHTITELTLPDLNAKMTLINYFDSVRTWLWRPRWLLPRLSCSQTSVSKL